MTDSIDRRTVLEQAAAGTFALVLARLVLPTDARADIDTTAGPSNFKFDLVKTEAKRLSEQAYARPEITLPEPFNKLSYDQYRDIRFRPEKALWRGEPVDFQIQPFAMGWLYDMPVDLWLVGDGAPQKLTADGKLFSLGPKISQGSDAAPFGFSGFRIHSPINRADYFDEFAVFQGASYLRAVGRGEGYGSSARGLSLNTARPGGEEFPFFRTFWIEKPRRGATKINIYALLDSQSTTGAYKFSIQPGEATLMDVEAVLYPRSNLAHVGIAALTSMFLHGQASLRRTGDVRPEVHDAEGLAMVTGSGERIWRPLSNPKTLQISAFTDSDPKGFGLCQRDRSFRNYEDLESRYERRPTVWVRPNGSWGQGFIELIEIPAEDEINDNVIAYWKPSQELPAGQSYTFGYTLCWAPDVPIAWSGARAIKTRIGSSKKPENFRVVIDFAGPAVRDVRDLPTADLNSRGGEIADISVQRNPEIQGVRVSFELKPGSADIVELRLILKAGDQPISETWLYRWTRP